MPATPWRVAIISVVPRVVGELDRLIRASGHEPAVVITQRRAGRQALPLPFVAAHVADDPEGLDVVFAASKRSLARILRAYEVDVAFCCGFSWVIPPDAIVAPPLGIVNSHPSLLPRYRGPFPLAWAIRNGDSEAGVTFHLMDATLDTGNVLAQAAFPLHDDDTSESVWRRVDEASSNLVPLVFERLARGERGDPQGAGEYCGPFEDAYRHVDPARTTVEVHRQVRAWGFVPPVVARGPLLERNGETVRVVRSSLSRADGGEPLECADGLLWIVETEPA